jgi:hypothetical protein
MKRARYLVFFELCFTGLLCLATFLFAIFVLGGANEEIGVVGTLLSFAQIALAFITLIVTHVTLRTVFRRGSSYQASSIAASGGFKAVPVVIAAVGLFHVLLLQVCPPGLREFGWNFTMNGLIYIFTLALGWHLVTAYMLKHAPDEAEAS